MIPGGFPCRDVVRERIISNSLNDLQQDNNTDNSTKANDNIEVEILENNQDDELITSQCPISIIPVESTTTTQEGDSDLTHQGFPSDIVTIHSDPSSPDLHSSSSTDESLRIAVDNFDDNMDIDSDYSKLENFMHCYRNCKLKN